ncbi:MAG: hypothetical protein ACI39U_01365 [Candidatus Cryptobacteroides sp.]
MKARHIFSALAATVLAVACDPEADYSIKNVKVEMKVVQVRSGYCEVVFSTNKDAYYYIAMEPVRENFDPIKNSSQFMNLALDYAYKEYINWRYELLYNGAPYIASFANHSLKYGEQDHYFKYLLPDTEYWLYCFAVNPENNKSVGELNIQTVRTRAVSDIEMAFEYRIEGQWDYVYPKSTDGKKLMTDVPWVGATADSLKIREAGSRVPGEYFDKMFSDQVAHQSANIFYGIYAHKNDGIGDGTTDTKFEEGHTYYTAVAAFDGARSEKSYVVHKFTWHENMKLFFGVEDRGTEGDWLRPEERKEEDTQVE